MPFAIEAQTVIVTVLTKQLLLEDLAYFSFTEPNKVEWLLRFWVIKVSLYCKCDFFLLHLNFESRKIFKITL